MSQPAAGRRLDAVNIHDRRTDMDETARVPGAALAGIQGSLLKLAIRRKLGAVPQSISVLWNHPTVFKDLMQMGRKMEKWGRLDDGLASLAAMAAAAEIGCHACLDLNYFLAHDRGLDVAKAREVPRWRESTVFSPIERRVLAYSEAVCQTPPEVTDELSAALLTDLGADGLIELTARIGFMNLSARMNTSLGIGSEHFADSCGLPPIATRPTRAPAP
jgi:alkylhydroperoxidase family enzyme